MLEEQEVSGAFLAKGGERGAGSKENRGPQGGWREGWINGWAGKGAQEPGAGIISAPSTPAT